MQYAKPGDVFCWRNGNSDTPHASTHRLKVTLDGRDVTALPIYQLQAGPDGSIEYFVEENGTYKFQVDNPDELETERKCGHVVFGWSLRMVT